MVESVVLVSRRAFELGRSVAYTLKEKTMSASGSYNLPASHRDAQAEIERLAAQAHSGWDKESWTLSWFGLNDGMSVLELGSGPGFITEQLLTLVPKDFTISIWKLL
jgi:predicted methyltransferase